MKPGASFLPEEFVVETRERRTGLLAAILLPVMIVAVFAAFLVTNRQWSEVRTAQSAVDKETERVAREIAEMKSLEKIRAQMNAKADLARGLLEPVPRSVLLAVLTNSMPRTVSLTSFELRTEEIKSVKPDPKADAKARASKSAASKARSTSAICRLKGFSQSTCFPASSARIDHSLCIVFGSGMYTASTSGSASSSTYVP